MAQHLRHCLRRNLVPLLVLWLFLPAMQKNIQTHPPSPAHSNIVMERNYSEELLILWECRDLTVLWDFIPSQHNLDVRSRMQLTSVNSRSEGFSKDPSGPLKRRPWFRGRIGHLVSPAEREWDTPERLAGCLASLEKDSIRCWEEVWAQGLVWRPQMLGEASDEYPYIGIFRGSEPQCKSIESSALATTDAHQGPSSALGNSIDFRRVTPGMYLAP